ncbi:MAG: hypothetical protein EBV75_03430, partial [Acidimicrobiia bacterium]|nr:hypothetical protein [Acidimicrobiia bacterium]
FDTIDEIGVRDGSNLSIDGLDFAPTFSIWTTIEETLNPPIVWEKNRGLYTTDCFSEPEIFHFPAGIGAYECVNVEHEEVIMIPREIDCNRVTFKYSLGAEFIDWLKTFAYLGLDSNEKIRVGDVSVSPRDVLAAVLPNPAKLFDAVPFLNLLGEYNTHHGIMEMGPGLWPSPKATGQPGWDRPVKRAVVPSA